MEIWELVARESVRDLVQRYNANGDSGRFDPLLELFAEDASMDVMGSVYRGHREIREFFEGVARGTGTQKGQKASFIRHFTSTHQIDVISENEARGRCYYAVLTDNGLDHWGRYVDEYRKVDGEWRFWKRKVSVDAGVPDGWRQSSRTTST
jgi:hypothetical protein